MDGGSVVRVWLPPLGGLWGVEYLFVSGSGPHDWVRWVGLLLALAGLAGVILARYTLGRSFSVAARATVLVTQGIYSRIRNPIYVSGMLFIAGVCLMLRRPYLGLLLIAIIPIQIVRARHEASVLEATFGDAYRAYRKRTWF